MSSNFLEIKNATFVASEKNKINNVSLTIKEKGEIVCLLGPSGVGKTTILRTIAGLQDLKFGEIKLKGKNMSDRDIRKIFITFLLCLIFSFLIDFCLSIAVQL